jgi:hypothetical protein
VVSAAVLVSGCGGSSGPPKPDSPKHAVQAFIAGVRKGDWRAACDVVDQTGRTVLGPRIAVNLNTELDTFGTLKNCPRSLAGHADKARLLVKGADPGSTRRLHSGTEVSSPRGAWIVSPAQPPSKGWQIDSFPPPR